MKRVCIIGCGAIGSLYAAHLARLKEVEVWAFTRRPEHARALNEHGLLVSGTHDFTAKLRATADPKDLPPCDFGIVACKATQTEDAFAPVGHHFDKGAVLSAQNGLGCEEVITQHTKGYVLRGTTFMAGTRHSDTHVRYELDAATWLGPFEPARTPFALVKEAAALLVAADLKAEALEDCKPAQWSKLIFNASVNSVSALTELPHCPAFVDERSPAALGHLLRALIEEGKQVAASLGIRLHDDPWEMNRIGARTNHPPSMLYDIQRKNRTEVDFLGGAIAREAKRAGLSAPLHTALAALIKGKEAAWAERE